MNSESLTTEILSSPIWLFLSHQLTWIAIAMMGLAFKSNVVSWFQIIVDRTSTGETDEERDKLIGVGVGVAIFSLLLLIELNLVFAIIVGVVFFIFTPMVLRKRRFALYQKTFDQSLVESLSTVSSSLKAGLTLKDALVVAAQNCPPIFSSEVSRVLKDYRFGKSIDSALDGVRKRVQTPNANIAFGALIIGTQLGGKIPEVLTRIVTTIREVDRVEGRLKALTAQGRAQGALLCSMPIIIGIGLYFLDRPKMELMLTTPLGKLLMGIVVFLEIVGILATIKVMRLDV